MPLVLTPPARTTNGNRGDHGCGLSGAQATAKKAVSHFWTFSLGAWSKATTFTTRTRAPFGGAHKSREKRTAAARSPLVGDF
jgi:hypothetical protein